MAVPIGPGDWVECIGPLSGEGGFTRAGAQIVGAYHVGLVTVCEAVTPAMRLPDGRMVPGIKVRAVKVFKGGLEIWLSAAQWRPIYTPKSEIIEQLLAPAPELEPAL